PGGLLHIDPSRARRADGAHPGSGLPAGSDRAPPWRRSRPTTTSTPLDSPTVQVEVTDKPLVSVEADLHAIGLFDAEVLPEAFRDLPGAGDVRTAFKKLTLLRPDQPARLL